MLDPEMIDDTAKLVNETRVEGLACWLVVCHYGHTFSFFMPERVKK